MTADRKPDFGGYATKNDLVCSDGLTIRGGAFKHNDGKKIPLVWHHQGTDSPENILGHAILENRPDGVYAYGFFNDSDSGKMAKQAVQHGDIDKLSIFANQLRKSGPSRKDIVHGEIHEVSLVMAGANPGAFIDSISFRHSDGSEFNDDEGVITTDDDEVIDPEPAEISSDKSGEDDKSKDEIVHADSSTDTNNGGNTVADDANKEDKTVAEIYESFDADQKAAVDLIVGEAVAAAKGGNDDNNNDGDGDSVEHTAFGGYQIGFKHAMNLFEQRAGGDKTEDKNSLTHDQLSTLMKDGARLGSLRESYLQHAEEYGITNIEYMFPDARLVGDKPELIARQADWVPKVLNATKHVPFAKIKSLTADITAPEARAKGYVKGNQKTEEVLELLKRTTGPATIYKKQKLDRDDILDITDFDVVVWLKWEIRFMLDEEVARAILIGDGRSTGSPDKVKDPAGSVDGIGIRSILKDADMYSHKVELAANVSNAVIVQEITRSRTAYRGSGSPTLYTTDAVLVDLLLQEDKMGRRLYETEAALAAALRVKEIVTVEVMGETPELLGIIVNLVDYSIGTNRGGEVTFFEDFDIDFNQNKYLMETRLSGALTKPKSAIVITRQQGTLATATAPSFDGETNTITVPTATGVVYTIDGEVVTGNVVITEDTTIEASAAAGYYLASNTTRSWTFTYTE
jgi:hypothetical protein